jgi:Domain of unknown function (DUF1771)
MHQTQAWRVSNRYSKRPDITHPLNTLRYNIQLSSPAEQLLTFDMGNAESQVRQQLQKFVDNVPDRQAGQYQQHYPPGQHQHQHQPYHTSDSNDDAEYTSWRQRAHQEAELRNQYYEQSQEAYRAGDGARGKWIDSGAERVH